MLKKNFLNDLNWVGCLLSIGLISFDSFHNLDAQGASDAHKAKLMEIHRYYQNVDSFEVTLENKYSFTPEYLKYLEMSGGSADLVGGQPSGRHNFLQKGKNLVGTSVV